MKKLSPLMNRLVRILNEHGYVDPIRDGAKSVTIVALIDRGILRPSNRRHGPFFPTTTPAQAWDEAHAEYARRAAEKRAHAECPEQWVQVDEDGTVWHVRQARAGYRIEIEQCGHRFWYARINGRTPMTAGGTFEEARRAADRFESGQAWDAAYDEHLRIVDERARERDQCEAEELEAEGGWGQPNGMLGTPEVEQARRTDLPCLAMTGDKRYSGGLRAAKGHEHPTDAPAPTAPEVHAFGRDILQQVSRAACGRPGSVRCGDPAVITCPECREIVAQRAQTIERAEASVAALTAPARRCVRIDGSHINHAEPVDGMNCDPDHPTAEDERVTTAQREAFGGHPGPRTMALRQQAGPEIDAMRADAAALRADVGTLALLVDGDPIIASIRARLDRIAGAVPQRATDPENGRYLYQHDCGHIDGHGAVPTYCYGCSTRGVGTWRALYTLPGDDA